MNHTETNPCVLWWKKWLAACAPCSSPPRRSEIGCSALGGFCSSFAKRSPPQHHTHIHTHSPSRGCRTHPPPPTRRPEVPSPRNPGEHERLTLSCPPSGTVETVLSIQCVPQLSCPPPSLSLSGLPDLQRKKQYTSLYYLSIIMINIVQYPILFWKL